VLSRQSLSLEPSYYLYSNSSISIYLFIYLFILVLKMCSIALSSQAVVGGKEFGWIDDFVEMEREIVSEQPGNKTAC